MTILYDRQVIVKCPGCGQVWSVNMPYGMEPDRSQSFKCWKCKRVTMGDLIAWVEMPRRWVGGVR